MCQNRDQGGRSDQVEPVPKKTHNLAELEKAKIRISAHELPITGPGGINTTFIHNR